MRPVSLNDDSQSQPLDYASPPRRSTGAVGSLAAASFNLLRPFSITGATTLLVTAWLWLDSCCTQYRAGDAGSGRTTAGWFVLGSPFLLGFALLASLLFSFIARRAGSLVGWLCLLAVFIPLIVNAYASTTPAARLRAALNIDPPPGTRIQRLEQFDSFNEGISIAGVCSTTPQAASPEVSGGYASYKQAAGRRRQTTPPSRQALGLRR